MIAGVDDLMRIFNLLSAADRSMFSELCTQKSPSAGGEVSYDPSIAAAVLVSTVKSLAAPLDSLIKIANDAGNSDIDISEDSIALRFVQYQRLLKLPSTMVQIIEEQCSDMITSFEEKTKANLYRYFLSCCSISPGHELNDGIFASTDYSAKFERLLSHTLTCVCSNIQRNLEDLMDFDFLWDASTYNTLIFGGDSLVEGTAKEFAWALSRTSCQSVLQEDGTCVESCERRYRILYEAACIDSVLAAILTHSHPFNGEGPEPKRIRPERDPRESRQYLVDAVGELLKHAVPDKQIVIERNDLNITVQQVATCILPFIDDGEKMDIEEKLIPAFLSRISSHSQRQTCAVRLKERQRSIVIEKAREMLSSISSHESHIEKAFELSRHVQKLQQRTYEHLQGFYQLDLSEREMLAPFVLKYRGLESNGSNANSVKCSQYSIHAISYKKNQEERAMNLNTVHISGWKEPPLADKERDELKKWMKCMSTGDDPVCIVAPSSRLKIHLQASSLPPPAAQTNGFTPSVLTWEKVALPVLNYCLSKAAKDFGATGQFIISKNGDHIVPFDATRDDQKITPSLILRLYYAALDIILHHDAAKRKNNANPRMVLNVRMHSSLFALCRFCIHKASHLNTDHRHDSLQKIENQLLVIEDLGTCPIIYYKLIESFIKALSSKSEYATSSYKDLLLPSRITDSLHRLQEMLLGLMWMQSCVKLTGDVDSTFVGMINNLKKTTAAWKQVCPICVDKESENTASNDRERIFVRYALRNLVKATRSRALALCEHLSVTQTPAIVSKTMVVFVNMLYHRVDMFIDRHPDQLMICSLYLVCSKMKLAPKIGFQQIKDAYMEVNESLFTASTLNAIFYEVRLPTSNESGDIVSFYNTVFIPNVLPFWKSFGGGN